MANKVLVVDDSRLARLALSKLLVKRDFEVDVAGSGGEALEYLKANRPAVVFMDFMMPDMDGYEVTLAISQNPDTASIPVVMCTSQDTPEDRQRAERNGARGFLTKPTTDDALDAVLLAIMPRPAPVAASPAASAVSAELAMSREEIKAMVERMVGNAVAGIAREAVQVAAEDAMTSAQATLENSMRSISQQVAKQTAEAVVAGLPKDNSPDVAAGIARTIVEQATRRGEEDLQRAFAEWSSQASKDLDARLGQWLVGDELSRTLSQVAKTEAKVVASQAADALLKRVAQQASETAEEVAKATAQRIAESASERAATAAAASISREATRQMTEESAAQWKIRQRQIYGVAALTFLASVVVSAVIAIIL